MGTAISEPPVRRRGTAGDGGAVTAVSRPSALPHIGRHGTYAQLILRIKNPRSRDGWPVVFWSGINALRSTNHNGGRSWPNVRRDRRYKSERNREKET